MEPGLILGKYQPMRRLGGSGGREVLLARVADRLSELCVVKRMDAGHAVGAGAEASAAMAKRLVHPNIARVLDFGHEGDAFYVVAEHLQGEDLRALEAALRERGEVLPLEDGLAVVAELAAGLHHAHEQGIVHGELVPESVLLTYDGSVKILGFGSPSGARGGREAYRSPEQCRGEAADRRSDVYTLGILLYELSTGHRLFQGRPDAEVEAAISTGSVSLPSLVRAHYPEALEAIVMRALALDPGARYATVFDLRDDLELFAQDTRLDISAVGLAATMRGLFGDAVGDGRTVAVDVGIGGPGDEGRAVSAALDFLSKYRQDRGEGPEEEPSPAQIDRVDAAIDGLLAELEGEKTKPETTLRETSLGATLCEAESERTERTPVPTSQHVTVEILSDADATARDATAFEQVPRSEPMIVLTPPSGLGRLWLLVALLSLGALAVVLERQTDVFHPARRRAKEEAARREEEAARRTAQRARVRLGDVLVESEPAEAAVWLLVGRTPMDTEALDAAQPHEVRIESEGFRAHDALVIPASFTGPPEHRVALVEARLEPVSAGYVAPAAPTGAPSAKSSAASSPSGPRGKGVLRVRSEPPGAQVWLLVGFTPSVRLSAVQTDRDRELKVVKDGYAPSPIVLARDAWLGESGGPRREVIRSVTLVKRP